MPFLHREPEPDAWFKLHWPRDLDEAAVLAMLRHLASTRRPSVVTFEVNSTKRRVTHLVGVPTADSERLHHLFATFVHDLLLEPIERPTPTLAHAVELRLATRERSLRTDAPSEIARSVVGALVGTTGTTVMQWQLGQRLSPLHVPKDSVGLPSTSRAIGQAFRYGLAPLDAKASNTLQAKIGDQGFRASLRIGTKISKPTVAKGVLRSVIGGLRVAEAPSVHFKVKTTDASSVMTARPARRMALAVNVSELTGLLAFPLGDSDYPGVTRMGSRRLPVPSAVSTKGRVIGEGMHPASRRPVALSARDGLMHTHVLGPTGVGKSTLLTNLALATIENGDGLVVIEPKGDLVEDILARIPKRRENDVVVLDPTDDEAPVGLNPLAGDSPELVSDQVMAVFRGTYGDYLGPRTSDVLHAALLTLAKSKQSTLVALALLLTDDRLRRHLTKPVRGDLALGPFWCWYEALSEAERGQVIAPVMNKVRPFVLRERVRHVLGQAEPRFNLADVFTKKRIVLVPLSKGTLGSETAALLGSLVVSGLWQAAQRRARLAPERRSPVTVIVDEFQDFLHLPTDFSDALAQARGLGVGFVLAHQHLAQLTPAIRAAVLANARSRVAFRLSADDAVVVAKTTNRLKAEDFQSLGRYEAYASLVADGETQPFASILTNPLPPASGDARRIRRLSRDRYGARREVIEAELRALINSDEDASGSAVGSRRRRPKDAATEGGQQ
jgi:energy-coupling factor transporter ATP-binding protein EcfA2